MDGRLGINIVAAALANKRARDAENKPKPDTTP
jgi:hypothetical protein